MRRSKNFLQVFLHEDSAQFTNKRFVFTGSTKNILGKKFDIGPKFSICARNKIRGLYRENQNKRLALLMPQK